MSWNSLGAYMVPCDLFSFGWRLEVVPMPPTDEKAANLLLMVSDFDLINRDPSLSSLMSSRDMPAAFRSAKTDLLSSVNNLVVVLLRMKKLSNLLFSEG